MRDFDRYSFSVETQDEMSMELYVLMENMHVFRNCENAIEEISQKIFLDSRNNNMISWQTDWSYNPELKRTVDKKEEPTLYLDGFPISIHYENNMSANNYMSVADRKIYSNHIIIGINAKLILMLDIYEIREKLKHEFGHLRQSYCQRNYDISQNHKFVVTDYDKVFRVSDKESEETLYDIVDEFMYIYSPAEIQQRYNELYQHMIDISQKDLEHEINHYNKRNIAVAHFVELTESIHMLNHMKMNLILLNNALSIQETYVPLVLAYYFKTYNIWKTSNYISQEIVQDYLDDKILENQIHRIAAKFYFWLENVVIRKYRHHIFSIIHYVLYSRLWGFEDSQQFGKTYSKNIISKLQQNIKELNL